MLQIKVQEIISGIVILLLVTACHSDVNNNYKIKTFTYDDIPETRHLTGKKLHMEGLIYPRRLLNLKNHLVVAEHNADTLISIIDKSTMKIVKKVGILGRGPGEMDVTRHLLLGDNENEFWAYQPQLRKAAKFNTDQEGALAQQTISLTGKMSFVSHFAFSSDTSYMLLLVDGNDKFVEFNQNGETINAYDTWGHMLEGNHPFSVISSIHQGYLDVNDRKQVYVLAALQLDRIEILDKPSGGVISVRGPVSHIPRFSIDRSLGYPMPAMDLDDFYYQYLRTQAGNNFIYTLYSGLPSIPINKGAEKFCNDIFLFDYEGNIKKRLVLDISICDMSIDEKNKRIYGLVYGAEPDIVVFDY